MGNKENEWRRKDKSNQPGPRVEKGEGWAPLKSCLLDLTCQDIIFRRKISWCVKWRKSHQRLSCEMQIQRKQNTHCLSFLAPQMEVWLQGRWARCTTAQMRCFSKISRSSSMRVTVQFNQTSREQNPRPYWLKHSRWLECAAWVQNCYFGFWWIYIPHGQRLSIFNDIP